MNVAEVLMESGTLVPGDKVYIQGPTTGSIEVEISEIRVADTPVQATKKGDRCSVPINQFLRRADKIYKIISSH